MSVDISNFPNLALADTPVELRSLPKERLPILCEELREYLLRSVSRSSGHFASGLGTVELTVALHYVYNTPFDRLVWDVGHQAYPHKILTGRRERIHTIRQKDGLHPFPWREESEYDVLSVGHSSTSIGAALGMAVAAESEGLGRKVVAVIGDGAITAGMAFEALNHAGDVHKDMLVVLNDNEMSISENVGALNNHLARLMSGKLYTTIREGGKKVLAGLPPVKELAKRAEEHLKGMVVPGTLFEEFGFNYIGPIDGHDIHALVETLRNMRNLKGPQLLHVKTKKGKGYEPAEKDPIGYHAVPKFNPDECALPKSAGGKPTFSAIFGQWLCDMAAKDERLVGITPAMREQAKNSFMGRTMLEGLEATCSVWKVPAVDDSFSEPINSNIPTLLLSGEIDPATPPSWGELAMEKLTNAKHFVAPYATHGVAYQSCANNLIADLVRSGSVNDLDGECLNKDVRRSFYLNASSVEPLNATSTKTTTTDDHASTGAKE